MGFVFEWKILQINSKINCVLKKSTEIWVKTKSKCFQKFLIKCLISENYNSSVKQRSYFENIFFTCGISRAIDPAHLLLMASNFSSDWSVSEESVLIRSFLFSCTSVRRSNSRAWAAISTFETNSVPALRRSFNRDNEMSTWGFSATPTDSWLLKVMINRNSEVGGKWSWPCENVSFSPYTFFLNKMLWKIEEKKS